jgi:hypothetical protein
MSARKTAVEKAKANGHTPPRESEGDDGAGVVELLAEAAPVLVAIGHGIRNNIGPVDLQREWLEIFKVALPNTRTAELAAGVADAAIKEFESRAEDLAGRTDELPFLGAEVGPAEKAAAQA